MLPVHSNPTIMRQDRQHHQHWATAPYNFVPLPEAVKKTSIQDQDVFSDFNGYIECKLTTESPLYVRCGMSPEFFKENGDKKFHELNQEEKLERAKFFHVDTELPVIPGSSLRGMVRSLVEIIGYGKVQWVTDKNLIYRSVGDGSSLGIKYRDTMTGGGHRMEYPLSNVRGGYLKKQGNKWCIQPACKFNGESFVHVEYFVASCGQHDPRDPYDAHDRINVYLRPPASRTTPPRSRPIELNLAVVDHSDDISRSPKPGFEEAVIVRSGHMNGKHMHCAIYKPNNDVDCIKIPVDMWKLYEEDRDMVRGFATRKLENDGDPLFYLVDDSGNLVFFGPTMMFRLPYDKKVLDFVPEVIRNPEDIDMAESIFGYASDKNKEGLAGRVFFTTATLEGPNTDVWFKTEPITPKILASPKPTTFQHYLVQDARMHHNPDSKPQLAHYATPTPNETVIRGCKIYWHKNNVTDVDFTEEGNVGNNDTQHTKIKPVKSGVTFSFRIYFENLRDCELGAMLWALKLPGEQGIKYRHKLGMGKPLGLGSVRIEPTLFISDRTKRYNRLFDVDSDQFCEAISEKSDNDVQEVIQAFEEYILDFLQSDRSRLSEITRIQMLLKMLEWPGPNPNETKYMTIRPVNQYKERPVLPDPFNIARPRR